MNDDDLFVQVHVVWHGERRKCTWYDDQKADRDQIIKDLCICY